MLGRLSAGLVIALVTLTTVVQDASAAGTKQTQAKATQKSSAKAATTKRAKRRVVAYRGSHKSYLVPPPPPYAPSILPELAYARSRHGYKKKAEEPEKVESQYKDLGVQAVEGYEDPEPVKQNKYVTYWNKG